MVQDAPRYKLVFTSNNHFLFNLDDDPNERIRLPLPANRDIWRPLRRAYRRVVEDGDPLELPQDSPGTPRLR